MLKHSNVHNSTHNEPESCLNALACIIRPEVHKRPRRSRGRLWTSGRYECCYEHCCVLTYLLHVRTPHSLVTIKQKAELNSAGCCVCSPLTHFTSKSSICRSRIEVHTDERTQAHGAQSSLEVTRLSINRVDVA